MPVPAHDALVDTAWLAAHLGAPDVKTVDATWFLPAMARDALVELAGFVSARRH